MYYWKECISEALDDAGISATDEQIDIISSWVEGAHDNYSMAHGYDVIGSPYDSQAKRELEKLKKEKDDYDKWVNRTKPCKKCTTTGYDRWMG